MPRGRPKGSTSVPAGRDEEIVRQVAIAIVEAVMRDKDIALKDRTNEAGHRMKAPAASAFAMACNALKKQGIKVRVDTVKKVYQARKADFFGPDDLIAKFEHHRDFGRGKFTTFVDSDPPCEEDGMPRLTFRPK